MREKAQRFDPRQDMHGNTYEIFHYLDIKTRHMEAHCHDFYEVFCFIDGEVDYWVEGSVYHLHPGDLLLINPMELHKPIPLSDTENYERIVLWLNKGYLAALGGGLDSCFGGDEPQKSKILRPTALQRTELQQLLGRLIRENKSGRFGSEMCAYGLLLQVMTTLCRISLESAPSAESYRTTTLISDVLAYIGSHYNEELTLERLASHFYVSKYHLSHEFSRAVGTGVHHYITMKRLSIAHGLLGDGMSPGQVGAMCGYSDYTAFFRAFKAEYGISPRECVGSEG